MSGLSEDALWDTVKECLKEELVELINQDNWKKIPDEFGKEREIRIYTKNISGLAFIRIYVHMDESKGAKFIDDKVLARYFNFSLID